MGFLQAPKRRLQAWLEAGHRDQSGAMAVLSLAAILIIVMVGMVIFDVAEVGVEKTHLQTSTDTAAFSQATVQARAMNQVAFANVGKRMTVGMVNTYINLNQFILNLSHIGTYLAIICGLASIAVPPLAGICSQLAQGAAGAASLYREERSVRDKIYTKGGPKCYREFFSCRRLRCRWRCRQNYAPYHEWAAPISEYQVLTLTVLPCGRIPTRMRMGPLKCANKDTISSWNPQNLIKNYYGRDLLAMDNYQRYMASLAPYWAWTEGTMRGLTNAAPVTVSYPMPRFSDQQSNVAQIPVKRAKWNDTCLRASSKDRHLNPLRSPLAFDILLKNTISGLTGGAIGGGMSMAGKVAAIIWGYYGSMGMNNLRSSGNIFHQMVPRDWALLCRDVTQQLFRKASGGGGPFGGFGFGGGGQYVASFEEYGRPFLLHNYQANRAQWLMDTSFLTFGFRPNAERFGSGGKSRLFLPGDYQREFPDVGGMWALSRSEISFQDGNKPHAWSPAWTARMRPVALPGEWRAYGDLELRDVFDELASTLRHVTTLAHTHNTFGGRLIRHPHSAGELSGAMTEELLVLRRALRGLDDEHLEGLTR